MATSFCSFVDLVLRVRLTPAQRVLALVAFDGLDPVQLRGEQRRIARTLFGDVDRIPALARAVLVAVCGARSGKSFVLCALRLVHLALAVDLSRLAPGEVAVAILCAPDLRLSRQVLRFAIGALESSPLRSLIAGQTADGVTLRREDGRTVVIEALPATRGGSSLRGRTLVGAALDECAFFRDENYAVNDAELLAAVSPRVLPDGQIIVASTPWIRGGVLWELFNENHGAPSTAIAAHAPTLLMRDNDPQVARVVEREQKRDPENCAREYQAVFVDGAGTLLASADVDRAVEPIASRPRRTSCNYAMAIDVGLRHDATGIVVFHVEQRRRNDGPPLSTLVVDATCRLAPKFLRRVSIEEVEQSIAELCERYEITKVFGDLTYADAISPFLSGRGITFVELSTSAPAQERRAMAMAARFSSGSIALVSDPVLVAELKDLRVTRHTGGRVTIAAPESRRKHDDMADALLLAHEAATTLPTGGGDIVATTTVHRWEGGIDVETTWRERRRNAEGNFYWAPSGPPVGSPAWVRLRKDQKSQGIHVLNEPDPDAFPDPMGSTVNAWVHTDE